MGGTGKRRPQGNLFARSGGARSPKRRIGGTSKRMKPDGLGKYKEEESRRTRRIMRGSRWGKRIRNVAFHLQLLSSNKEDKKTLRGGEGMGSTVGDHGEGMVINCEKGPTVLGRKNNLLGNDPVRQVRKGPGNPSLGAVTVRGS